MMSKADESSRTSTMMSSSSIPSESQLRVPLAVIGWSHKLPGDAETSVGFWRMLCEGRTAHGRVPKDRFNVDAFYHPDHTVLGTMSVATGHFLKQDIAAFDAPFFAIQPAEAVAMDPQQRLLLETTYHALENAGLTMELLAGSNTSVYIGALTYDYEIIQARDPENGQPYLGIGIGGSILANRISWFFNLRGESMVIDTACSSGLTCLHLASRALQTKDSDVALVGAVNIMIAPDSSFFHHSNMGFLSPEGQSYAFDERASGYGKGEGTAVIVLKRLDHAVRDGDVIRAVIGAIGANQDGRTPGITQPSAEAQEANMRTIHERFGIDPNDVQYVEAHGTGTQLGDPTECAAIANTFRRDSQHPLIVGTVKPNIGHLEAVAGLAGLIKAVLCLEKGLIPPNALYRTPNPRIDVDQWNLKFPSAVTNWPTDGPRTPAVSSFGYGGSNAYVILHDVLHFLKRRGIEGSHSTDKRSSAIAQCSDSTLGDCPKDSKNAVQSESAGMIFLWSSADEATLRKLISIYEDRLNSIRLGQAAEDDFMHNLCSSLSNRRTVLLWKTFTVAQSFSALKEKLSSKVARPVRSSGAPTLVFVFTGQGAQWFAMGRELICYSAFATSLRRAEKVLEQLPYVFSPQEELFREKHSSRVDQPLMSQTLCTILQLALVDLLTSIEVHPNVVVGHSSGEIAAAYCVGGLSFESAVRAASYRGYYTSLLLVTKENASGMISVQLSPEKVQPFIDQALAALDGMLVIACENSPQNVTLSGSQNCIEYISDAMKQKGVFARQLQVPLAYHSPQTELITAAYAESLEGLTARKPKTGSTGPKPCMMFSTVTGQRADTNVLVHPSYWVSNMVSTVRFFSALTNLVAGAHSGSSDSLERGHVHILRLDHIRP